MGLSETRKIISAIAAAVTAVAAAILISSLVLSSMLTSQRMLQRVLITDDLVSQCERQLDAKYEVLEAETGIPLRVFEQVKQTYGVRESLNSALSNALGGEDATLYNSELTEHFNTLCSEFLSGSKLSYTEADTAAAAQRAARIYSETVGFHNTDFTEKRISSLRDFCAKAGLISLLAILFCALILAMIYSKKKKGLVFSLAGLSGGFLGAALGALLLIIFKTYDSFGYLPAAFEDAAAHAVKICFILLLAAGIILAAAFYFIFLLVYRSANKPEE